MFTIPKLKIPGFKDEALPPPPVEKKPAATSTTPWQTGPVPKPALTLPPVPTTSQTSTPQTTKMTTTGALKDTAGFLFDVGKGAANVVKGLAQTAFTEKGRQEFKDAFVEGTPAAVAALQTAGSAVLRKVDAGARKVAETINLPGQVAEFVSNGVIKAPKIKVSGLEQGADKLEAAGQENFKLHKTLESYGVKVADERTFLQKIQDPSFLAKGLGQNAPNLLISLGLAAPAAVLGAPAAVVGGAAFATSALSEGGSAYNEARDFLANSPDESQRALANDRQYLESIAIPVGVVNGLLDSLPITEFLTRSPLGAGLKKQIMKEATGRIIKQAAGEGATESIQEIVSNSVAKIYDENRDVFQGVGEAGFFGALMGGAVSGVGDLPGVTKDLKAKAGMSIEDVSGGKPTQNTGVQKGSVPPEKVYARPQSPTAARLLESGKVERLDALYRNERGILHEGYYHDAGLAEKPQLIAKVGNLKLINEDGGHKAGDAAIAQTGEILQQAFPTAEVIHQGGKNFAVITDALTHEELVAGQARLRELAGPELGLTTAWGENAQAADDKFARDANNRTVADTIDRLPDSTTFEEAKQSVALTQEAKKYKSAEEFAGEFERVWKLRTQYAFDGSARENKLTAQEEALFDMAMGYLQTPEVAARYKKGDTDTQILADFYKRATKAPTQRRQISEAEATKLLAEYQDIASADSVLADDSISDVEKVHELEQLFKDRSTPAWNMKAYDTRALEYEAQIVTDMDKMSNIDQKYGKEAGDQIVAIMVRGLQEQFPGRVYRRGATSEEIVAKLSPEEMKSPETLEKLAASREYLKREGVRVKGKDGQYIQADELNFTSGIGENFKEADDLVNGSKKVGKRGVDVTSNKTQNETNTRAGEVEARDGSDLAAGVVPNAQGSPQYVPGEVGMVRGDERGRTRPARSGESTGGVLTYTDQVKPEYWPAFNEAYLRAQGVAGITPEAKRLLPKGLTVGQAIMRIAQEMPTKSAATMPGAFDVIEVLADSLKSLGVTDIVPSKPGAPVSTPVPVPVSERPNEELIEYRAEQLDPRVPATLDEFNKLSFEKQQEVFDDLPLSMQSEILGTTPEETMPDYDGHNGLINEIVYGKTKIKVTKDATRDFRGYFNPADYRQAFRVAKGENLHLSSIDELAQDNGFESDDALAQALAQAFDAKRERTTRLLEERQAIRAKKIEESKRIKDTKTREAFVRDIGDAVYEELTRKRYSILQKAKAVSEAKSATEEKFKGIKDALIRLNNRRVTLNAIKKIYNLTDGDFRTVRGNRDPRYMTHPEFAAFVEEVKKRAGEVAARRAQYDVVQKMIAEREYKKIENLQKALEMPSLEKMSTSQLEQFEREMAPYAKGDTFLGPRMIQTIINTDLGKLRTIRELRQSLAEQAGVNLSELDNVHGDWGDEFNPDQFLAEKNPLYKYMVTEWTAKKIETDEKLLELKRDIDRAAKASRRSRSRTLTDRLVPQDDIVVEWLQPYDEYTKDDKTTGIRMNLEKRRAVEKRMTPEELAYAKLLDTLYKHYYMIAAEDTVTRKTLLGVKLSRFKGVYFPHSPMSFLERWKDDGFIAGIKGAWQNLTEQKIDFDAAGPSGEVLGYEKFLKYALKREGVNRYSKNAARVSMAYAAAFEKKLALDAIIPKIDAYVFSLQRGAEKTALDPEGLGIDGQLRTFVKEWLNNKKGRRKKLIFSQGSGFDATMRGLKLFLSLKDLGINIITGLGSIGGNVWGVYNGLALPQFKNGVVRAISKKGNQMGRKYHGVIGEPIMEDLISASNDIGDTLKAGAFALLQTLAYRAKRQFFLGSLTKEEWASGQVSRQRLAQIKLEMARFLPLEDVKSVIGSTSEVQAAFMYKSWAVPLLFSAYRNAGRLLADLKAAESSGDVARAFTSDASIKLLKSTIGSLGLYLFFNLVWPDDEDDKSFVMKLRRKLIQDSASSLSALDPGTWISTSRPIQFVQELYEAIVSLVKMEEYKTSGEGYSKGELKGVKKLGRALLPGAVRQLTGGLAPDGGGSSGSSRSSASPAKVNIKTNIKIPKVKIKGLKLKL